MMKEKEEQHLEWLQQHQTTEPHLGLERVRRLLALRESAFASIGHSCCWYQWKRINNCAFTSAFASKEATCWNVYITLSDVL